MFASLADAQQCQVKHGDWNRGIIVIAMQYIYLVIARIILTLLCDSGQHCFNKISGQDFVAQSFSELLSLDRFSYFIGSLLIPCPRAVVVNWCRINRPVFWADNKQARLFRQSGVWDRTSQSPQNIQNFSSMMIGVNH